MKTTQTLRQAHIDLDALQANYRCIKSLAPQAKRMAMVKSNAYGHGLVEIASALPDADAFGVATLGEAVELREAGIVQKIVLLPGVFEASELALVSHHGIDLVVHQEEQLVWLVSAVLPHPLHIWLKIDTGMHRLGFPAARTQAMYERLMACQSVAKSVVIMSHFSNADEGPNSITERQLGLFNQSTEGLLSLKSIAHSAGILSSPASHFDWVRPGILLYGISPMVDTSTVDAFSNLALRAVMTLQARLIAINLLHSGDRVGYGGHWTCDEDMPIGVVSIGYGDGYPRHAPSGTPVLVNGVLCPLVGRVSMDFLMIDLRPCPQAKISDRVVLWGAGLPIEIVAKFVNTIPYTLICQLSSRVKFVYSSPINKLRLQCRRGMLELDILLERILEHDYVLLSFSEQAAFARLLDYSDPELLVWLTGQEDPLDPELALLMDHIRK